MAERSIDTIYSELVASIVSQAGSSWSALKDSMVGRELLYAGANIISATERVSSSVLGVLDIGRYGLDQLVSYAYGQDVSLDLSRPGSVKVRVLGNPDVIGGVFAPFSLRLTVGVLSFYNIDYCSVGDVITLYCGTPRMSVSNRALSLPFSVGEGLTDAWRLYVELTGGSYRSSYLKLDESVMSSSVWVFAQAKDGSGPVFPYTAYNAMLSDPDAQLYKVRRLWDYSTAVLFGDGNWAHEILLTQYDYAVVWLAGNYSTFTITRGVTMNYTDPLGKVTEWGQLPSGASGVGFEVVSSQVGVSRSVSYARNYLVAELFKTQGLVTAVQLENFVLSFPSVQSAYLALSKDNVKVYVKPVLEGDTSFEFITDYLYQYGVSGVSYECVVGTPLGFLIRLKSSGTQGLNEMSRAASVLSHTYSYDNVTMSTRVSSSLVQQELSLQGIRNVVATLYGRVYLSDTDGGSLTLPSSAGVGSIRLYGPDGMLLGFDSEGRFKGYDELGKDQVSLLGSTGLAVSAVGDFWWVSGFVGSTAVSYLVSILEDGRLGFADSSVSFAPVEGASMTFAPYGEGLYCLSGQVEDDVFLYLYRASSVFGTGSYSLFNHPSYVTPLSYVTGVDDNGNPVRGSRFTLRKYTSATDGVSVSVLRVLGASGVGGSSDTVVCAIRFGTDVYGLGVYRLGSTSKYDWDLAMMYGGSSASLVTLSSFYDGQWYMPLGDDSVMTGVGVFSASIGFSDVLDVANGSSSGDSSSEGSIVGGDALTIAKNKVYRLETVDSASGVLKVASLIDWRITSASEGWVLYKNGDSHALSSMQFSLLSKASGESVFQYRFDRTYTIKVDDSVKEEPLSLGLSDGVPVVYGAYSPAEGSGSKCWWVLPVSGSEMVRKALADGVVVTVMGSVDYETGIVYGLPATEGGYVEYEVSSVLGGEGSYPYLLDISAE